MFLIEDKPNVFHSNQGVQNLFSKQEMELFNQEMELSKQEMEFFKQEMELFYLHPGL